MVDCRFFAYRYFDLIQDNCSCCSQTIKMPVRKHPRHASQILLFSLASRAATHRATRLYFTGNDLLLDVPDIARAGSVKAKAVSTVARTDGMWLLSLHAAPDSGSALFVGMQFDVSALPEATLNLQLYKTQPVLLVARAGGKYYGIYREVKVGQTGTAGAPK